MTYHVGDDANRTYAVIDDNGGTIALEPTVVASNSTGDVHQLTAAWATAVAPLPDVDGATFRDIDVPLADLPAGLWAFTLTIPDEPDLFLGNVVIQ